METKDTFDKSLDLINERRKKLREERDKCYKTKEEMRDDYYGQLIVFQKQQYLLQDIKWMNEMQGKIKERAEEKEKRDREYRERKEKIQKERDDRKARDDERK
jgi:hypothetical protein